MCTRSISIHALREESDRVALHFAPWRVLISIHALREESDAVDVGFKDKPTNFNPRSPRGERLDNPSKVIISSRFQSTLSARRATRGGHLLLSSRDNFNPRSPRGERRFPLLLLYRNKLFQSTLSARRATYRIFLFHQFLFRFQSTLSARRATVIASSALSKSALISIHALREESDSYS